MEQEWYRRLKDSGFVDIEEKRDHNTTLPIKRSDGAYRHQKCPIVRQARRDYFLLLGHYVQSEKFDSASDRTVLTLRAEGWLLVEIAKEVKKNRNLVREIIRRYEVRWGIRTYSPSQLDGNYRRDNRE